MAGARALVVAASGAAMVSEASALSDQGRAEPRIYPMTLLPFVRKITL
ncbi:MAG: hypothetical protein P8X49_14850 [Syntrophobacterales bacterium]